jgi:hypothetical protein
MFDYSKDAGLIQQVCFAVLHYREICFDII